MPSQGLLGGAEENQNLSVSETAIKEGKLKELS
jgi:hypothetical protein